MKTRSPEINSVTVALLDQSGSQHSTIQLPESDLDKKSSRVSLNHRYINTTMYNRIIEAKFLKIFEQGLIWGEGGFDPMPTQRVPPL